MDGVLNIPRLNPLLKLYPSAFRFDGEPQWTIHHPVSNQFYKIGWAEFECLSRFHKYKSADDLIQAVNDETSLTIDRDDIENVIKFLGMNGLLDVTAGQNMAPQSQSLAHKIMHGYLYFTYPLIRPESFLKRTMHYVAPLFSKQFHMVMMIVLSIAIVMAIPNMDEFFASFTQIFTFEGVILSVIVLTAIKIIHEFAHAYQATIEGVSVPHMGVAFIVMYPILYTEATGTWRLTNKKSRMSIGLAGVRFELYLAAIALILWHFMVPGLGQMICFTIVMISLAGSLLINLNPLMRFDGYYVLSDYVGIENLHAVALDYARHAIRKTLLGLNDDLPHDYPPSTSFALTAFGFAILIYRFFLFLGIALLVYFVFMKPLGLLAMILELAWFIAIPIFKEFKLWWERKHEFINNYRFKITALIFGIFIIMAVIPAPRAMSYPAVMHAKDYQTVYAPVPSILKDIMVREGDKVSEGQIMAVMHSDRLDYDIQSAKTMVKNLQNIKRREQTNIDLYRSRRQTLDVEIDTAKDNLKKLLNKQSNLTVKAQFDGVIVDVNKDVQARQAIGVATPLFRLIKPTELIVTAYIPESDVKYYNAQNNAIFRPLYQLIGGHDAQVEKIDNVNIQSLDFESLGSLYGGEIPVKVNEEREIIPLSSLYKMTLELNDNQDILLKTVVTGHVIIQGPAKSLLFSQIKKWVNVVRQELSLN